MAFDNTVTVVGNITRDPELRFTPSGAAVANFGSGVEPKRPRWRRGGVVLRHHCVEPAGRERQRVAEQGHASCCYGRLDQRSWENQDGDRRSKVEIVADDIAPSLKWATAEVTGTLEKRLRTAAAERPQAATPRRK